MNKLYNELEHHHIAMKNALSKEVDWGVKNFKPNTSLTDDWLVRTYHIVLHYYLAKSKDGNIDEIIKECYPLVEIFYIKLIGNVENALKDKLKKLNTPLSKMRSAEMVIDFGVELNIISSGDRTWMTDVRKIRNAMGHADDHKMVTMTTALTKYERHLKILEKIDQHGKN